MVRSSHPIPSCTPPILPWKSFILSLSSLFSPSRSTQTHTNPIRRRQRPKPHTRRSFDPSASRVSKMATESLRITRAGLYRSASITGSGYKGEPASMGVCGSLGEEKIVGGKAGGEERDLLKLPRVTDRRRPGS